MKNTLKLARITTRNAIDVKGFTTVNILDDAFENDLC